MKKTRGGDITQKTGILRPVAVVGQNSGCPWGDAKEEGAQTGKPSDPEGGRVEKSTADWVYLICLFGINVWCIFQTKRRSKTQWR